MSAFDSQSPEDLDEVFTSLCEQHHDFVMGVLRARRDVLEESAKDLAQNVLMALWRYVREREPPRNVRGFLFDLIEKEIIDDKRTQGRRPALDGEVDAEAMADSAPDPEQSVDAVQHLEKVERCLAALPEAEAEAVCYIELLETTIEQTSRAVNRPQSTVAAQHARGMTKLRELANAPEEPAPPRRRRPLPRLASPR
jgi:RNA polymerase sigma factor (sigma-70 family)